MKGRSIAPALLLAWIFVALAVGMAWAETRVSADSTEASEGRFILSGNVVIEGGDTVLRADSAVYDEAGGQINAIGNITVSAPGAEARAARAEFNVQDATGSLQEAELKVGHEGLKVSSDNIRMEGPGRFVLNSASFTTCKGLPPVWCIKGKDINVLSGERVSAWHAMLKIRGVPVFYTPYIWVPIVDERRSGFLMPEIGYRSATGFYYSQPFFWAISRSQDATLTMDYHVRRALGQTLQYRFLTGPVTGGRLDLRHLRDYKLERDYGEVRALYDGRGEKLSAGLDIKLVNRQDYYLRMGDLVDTRSSRYLDSRLELWHPLRDHSRIYFDSLYKYDLKPGVDNETVMQKPGRLGFFVAPRHLGAGFMAYGGASASAFEREEGYDGRRARANINLMHSLDVLPNLTQTLGYETASYSFANSAPYGDSMSAGYLSYGARADFRAEAHLGDTLALHTVEHTFEYNYMRRSGDIPPLFDSAELRGDRSEFAFALTQRLRGSQGEFLKARLRQAMDVSMGSEKLLPLTADISTILGPLNARIGAAYDHYVHGLSTSHMGAGLVYETFHLNMGHGYDRVELVETYTMDAGVRLSRAWELSAGARYDEKDEGGFEQTSASATYTSQCWSAKASYIKRPDDYTVFMSMSLLGLGVTK